VNEVIQIVTWQLILFFIFAVLSGAIVYGIVVPVILRNLMELDEKLKKIIKGE